MAELVKKLLFVVAALLAVAAATEPLPELTFRCITVKFVKLVATPLDAKHRRMHLASKDKHLVDPVEVRVQVAAVNKCETEGSFFFHLLAFDSMGNTGGNFYCVGHLLPLANTNITCTRTAGIVTNAAAAASWTKVRMFTEEEWHKMESERGRVAYQARIAAEVAAAKARAVTNNLPVTIPPK